MPRLGRTLPARGYLHIRVPRDRLRYVATGGAALPKAAPAATATITYVFTGTGSVRIPKPAPAGTGAALGNYGSAAIPKPAVHGTGLEKITAAGTVRVPKAAVHGTSAQVITGTGSAAKPKPSLAGAGRTGLNARALGRGPEGVAVADRAGNSSPAPARSPRRR